MRKDRGWPCKTSIPGSNPGGASNFSNETAKRKPGQHRAALRMYVLVYGPNKRSAPPYARGRNKQATSLQIDNDRPAAVHRQREGLQRAAALGVEGVLDDVWLPGDQFADHGLAGRRIDDVAGPVQVLA